MVLCCRLTPLHKTTLGSKATLKTHWIVNLTTLDTGESTADRVGDLQILHTGGSRLIRKCLIQIPAKLERIANDVKFSYLSCVKFPA